MVVEVTLKGTVTALITPFKDQEIDKEGFAANIYRQIASKVDGILILGTTGEAPTLSMEEQKEVISLAVKEIKKQVPLWVGTGSYCTRQTIEKTEQAREAGADVALIVTPYYNRPTQEGIFHHFEAITHCVQMPIVIYNHAGRCGTNIETQTLLRLAQLPNVVGIKEASGNMTQITYMLNSIAKQTPHLSLFSGDDLLTLPILALGGHGVISVASNLFPSHIKQLTQLALGGNFEKARVLHNQLMPFYQALSCETNPIPIKKAMELCGHSAGKCRLPLGDMDSENEKKLAKILKEISLWKKYPSDY